MTGTTPFWESSFSGRARSRRYRRRFLQAHWNNNKYSFLKHFVRPMRFAHFWTDRNLQLQILHYLQKLRWIFLSNVLQICWISAKIGYFSPKIFRPFSSFFGIAGIQDNYRRSVTSQKTNQKTIWTFEEILPAGDLRTCYTWSRYWNMNEKENKLKSVTKLTWSPSSVATQCSAAPVPRLF